MFNVGDVVRGIKDPEGKEYYAITDSTRTSEVTWVDGEHIRVRPEGYSTSFNVISKYFKLERIELENK